MKTLTAVAVALLLSTTAYAQQTPDTSGSAPSGHPTGNQGQTPMTPHNTGMQGTSSGAASTSANAGNRFQTNQGQDQWLVGNLWHKSVYNAAGQSIGDLNDILIDKDGKIAAIVVGVGGFLGLGEKNVAVDFDQLKQHGNVSGDRITLGMSEQDLRNAPTFQKSGSSSSNR